MTDDDIVREALTWLGTPYRHQASLKGVGCDCLGLVRGVWRACIGPEPETMPAYTPDWAEANGFELMADAAGRHMTVVPAGDLRVGDVLLFRWKPGYPAKHAGILIEGDRFIHAHEGAVVALAPLDRWWRGKLAGVYRWPGRIP
ncbi:NlpC/P60 family protein [Oryzibacter oryziterrae]|uniref:NlpC/P60 family protein n=1 Tax=Oryzibacter oryziterrae TaxID=2766474 RepID=UPI001F374B9A|nr:NlpC/P60 family protein [Oryzibacter oryziterrae]